ncbi:MAG: hypothetical protein ABL971_01595 [Vicinamibacterales bacterium]
MPAIIAGRLWRRASRVGSREEVNHGVRDRIQKFKFVGMWSIRPSDRGSGVTGPRTLGDDAAIARASGHLLAHVEATRRSPFTPLALTVVPPLAEGADHLFPAAVLARPGARLAVVTPFALAVTASPCAASSAVQFVSSVSVAASGTVLVLNTSR